MALVIGKGIRSGTAAGKAHTAAADCHLFGNSKQTRVVAWYLAQRRRLRQALNSRPTLDGETVTMDSERATLDAS